MSTRSPRKQKQVVQEDPEKQEEDLEKQEVVRLPPTVQESQVVRDVAVHASHILDHPLPVAIGTLGAVSTTPQPHPPLRRDPNYVSLPIVRSTVPTIVTTSPGLPINVPTRGYVPDIQQVGILTNATHDQILPLFGRPMHPGSSKWMYFASTDKFQSVKVPVHRANRNCSAEFGCDELYDQDTVSLPAYGNREFKTTLYSLDAPRYIPYV